MENRDKIDRAISDKEMKSIKKLAKNLLIIVPKSITNEYIDLDLVGAKIKIANIRKYKNRYTRWSDNKEHYVYEIDVIVDMNTNDYFRSNNRCQSNARRFNGWYRRSILKIVDSESFLKYFNIDVINKSTISKITYQKID